MGIMGNTTSLSRFQVGEIPGALKLELIDVGKGIHNRLWIHRFRSIADNAEEMSAGWVELRNHKSTKFPAEDICIGHHIGLSIRIDERRIPPAVLKERTEEAMEDYLAKNPDISRISKMMREEIKERVKKQLLPQTLPVPSVYDLIWNTETGEIWFANTSTKGIELLDMMWRKTFPEISLRMMAPYDIAAASIESNLLDSLAQANQASSQSLLDMMVSNKWLGQDFLLWFLHESVSSTEPEGALSSAWTDDKVVVQGNNEAGKTVVSITGPQAKISELKAALREGKQITEATMYFQRHADESEWKLTFKGETFHMNGYKCPSVHIEADGDPDAERQAVFLERVSLIRTGIDLLQQDLRRFLTVRLTDRWSECQETIREWLAE